MSVGRWIETAAPDDARSVPPRSGDARPALPSATTDCVTAAPKWSEPDTQTAPVLGMDGRPFAEAQRRRQRWRTPHFPLTAWNDSRTPDRSVFSMRIAVPSFFALT
jgi:hypothetical protein